MTLPERGWKGYGRPGGQCNATRAIEALRGDSRRALCAQYRLADDHLTRAHKGLALMAEIPLRRRYDVARDVTDFLALVAITEGE